MSEPISVNLLLAGFILCAIVGFVAGALATVKVFLIMHAKSIPPECRSKLKARRNENHPA